MIEEIGSNPKTKHFQMEVLSSDVPVEIGEDGVLRIVIESKPEPTSSPDHFNSGLAHRGVELPDRASSHHPGAVSIICQLGSEKGGRDAGDPLEDIRPIRTRMGLFSV